MDSIDKINAFLAIRGWSGADLERAIGASHSVYSQWNTRQTKPSNRSLAKVAAALGVGVSEILPDVKPSKNEQKKESDLPKDDELDEVTKAFIEKIKLLDADTVAALDTLADTFLAKRNK